MKNKILKVGFLVGMMGLEAITFGCKKPTPTSPTPTAPPAPTSTPVYTATPTPVPGIDLIVTGMSGITMNNPVPGCVPSGGPYPPLGIIVFYQNIGNTATGSSFQVAVDSITTTVAALSPGQSGQAFVQGAFSGGNHTASIDYSGIISETNETNNTLTQFAAVPTLPPDCTSTPTVTSTPTLGGGTLPGGETPVPPIYTPTATRTPNP